MDALTAEFEKVKISAFSKYSKLTGDIHNVTIGPNSVVNTSREEPKPRKPKTKKKVSFQDDSPSKTPLPLAHIFKEFETQRKEKVQEAIDDHFNKFETFSKIQNETQANQWISKQQAFIQSVHEGEQMILNAVNQQDVNKTRQNEKLVKHYQEMIQRKMHYEQQLEKTKEKQRKLNENIERIKKCQVEFRTVYQEIIAVIKSCSSGEELKRALGDNFKLLKSLPESFEEIVSKCKNYNVEEEQLAASANILLQLKNLKLEMENMVSNIKKKEEAKVVAPPPVKETKTKEVESIAGVDQFISATNLRRYSEIKQFLSQHSQLFKELVNDEQLKQFRFDCKKAVNIPVNAISAVSAEHLRDKYTKLVNLLSGKTVSVADKQINAARHPQGVPFCMDLLARKFVLQGDLMISSNPEAAFCYATIIISLWNDFPDFGRLLLGYFYTQCPYLVPFYIPKTEDQSNEEYYVSLGYHYNDGQIEKQDKFLKRMTGIFRLYFAIAVAKPKRDQAKNPHDITNAWNFLGSLLRLEPQLDITATTLHIFLETVGFEMEAVYGLAFKKLVRIIGEKFIPMLKKIDTGGPVTRLEVLLQDYREKGHFERPNGVLSWNFW